MPVSVSPADVTRLWLHLQGFSVPRGHVPLNRTTLVGLLEQVGGLQLDSVNALERAHYLTLWSRFGPYSKAELDAWIYDERLAYEYWGHEASILPMSHLPLGLRSMRRFPPAAWKKASWWTRWQTSPASKRRVMRLLREKGPIERTDIKAGSVEQIKEDKQSLRILWHAGKAAISSRRHFRRVYDLAERVYPEEEPASGFDLEDSWLLIGLRGNGIASEKHLIQYWTGPKPAAAMRQRIIARNLRKKRILAVHLYGFDQTFYALPEHLEQLGTAPEPRGTTLICPFDSLLWQRKRAEELLNFTYRLEIYTPPRNRIFGYYVCPILHNGRLIGRLDPKMHRATGNLEVKQLFLEHETVIDTSLRTGLRETLASLASLLGATTLQVPETPVSGLQ